MLDDEMITISDARAAGYCVAGIKQWFAAADLDFASFVRNGIRVGDLPDKENDATIQNILRVKGVL